MTIKLEAIKRTVTGKKVSTLRKKALLPATVYGRGVPSVSVEVGYKDFLKTLKSAGETTIVNLGLDGVSRPVLVHQIQRHPLTDEVLHVDFLQVDLTQKIKAEVPVVLVGESPAEKSGIGTVVTQLDEIEVEALPSDLPKEFEVDVTGLDEVDKAIYVKDLVAVSDKVAVLADPDAIIVKVEPPQKEEVAAKPVEETPSETPVTEGTPAGETEKTPKVEE